jgi:hypothetical protein
LLNCRDFSLRGSPVQSTTARGKTIPPGAKIQSRSSKVVTELRGITLGTERHHGDKAHSGFTNSYPDVATLPPRVDGPDEAIGATNCEE